MHFPDVRGESLTGEALAFPRDFAGGRTIALVAFDLKARAQLETWVPFIDRFARNGTVRGRVFATLPSSMRIVKSAIIATMRKSAPSAEARSATVALFVDLEPFCAALEITDRASVHTFVIETDGTVSAHYAGPYTAAAGTAIEARVAMSG